MLNKGDHFDNLVVGAGMFFFKHDIKTDALEIDYDKIKQVFPHLKTIPKFRKGIDFYKLVLKKDRVILHNILSEADNHSNQQTDIRIFLKETNEIIWLRFHIMLLRNKDNVIMRYGSVQNITSDKSYLVKTTYTAYIDNLTGLINRERMKQKISLAIGTAHEYKIQHGLVAINIDHLATINSMFGYQVTNDLIEEVAKKINSFKRQTDVVARVSSGKFAILLVDTKKEDIKRIGERFLDIIRNTNFETRSGIISVTTSGAGCSIPLDASNADNTLTILDECLSIAKKRGRDNFVLYDPDIDTRKMHQENIILASKVIYAIQNEGILTAYQPILHKSNTSQSFMECLARIQDVQGEVIPAYKFIPIAENIGFIKNIDMKLFENALKMLNKYDHLKLSINISGYTLYNVTQNSTFYRLLDLYKEVSNRLCLELTETIPLQTIDNLDKILKDIKKFGYKIGLDDFGAGYNSFANLNHFDFDIVKIDGMYVKNIAHNCKNQIFVQTLTDLAKKLNIEIVAEMIDNQQDLDYIKELGIDYYQGYFFSPPSVNFLDMNRLTYDLQVEDIIESNKSEAKKKVG